MSAATSLTSGASATLIGRIEGAYLGARQAFRSPTLSLLHKRDAPLVVALLNYVFRADRPRVQVADAHTEIQDALDQLRAAGHEDLPADKRARELCRDWVNAGWLITLVEDEPGSPAAFALRGGGDSPASGEGGVEVYRLSAHAVGALEIAGRAGGARARVSRSRVRTLLDAVERLSQDADPDVATRTARLQREIDERRKELKRLDKEGAVPEVSEEQLLEEAENVLALMRELPADFTRVAESIKAIQRETVTSLRRDERPAGEVLREYLDQAEHLMSATAEGRAFAGALGLIGDAARLDDLAASIDTVLRHPFARQLPVREATALRGVTATIERGLDDVLTAQRQASRVITTQVRNHDPLRDRQVDELLREVIAGLGEWVPTTRRGQNVDPLRRLPRADVGRIRTTLADLAPPRGPEPLDEWPAEDEGDIDLEHATAWGGPNYAALGSLLAAARLGDPTLFDGEEAAEVVSLAEIFARAPEGARRPVDLVGLLEMVARVGLIDLDGEYVEVEAVRPDGTRRRLAFAPTAVAVNNRSSDAKEAEE
ncbi:MAG: DUF3375 domain-containing protein [Promicromonosporaceae bacterium]|nr:DUF3375 domain-containing protein [Promicromonosporaceae bacterium]